MPSNRWTNEQLTKLLKERTNRLSKFAELQAPPIVTSREIAMVVTAARLLFGREIVDKQIDEFQSETDAREVGLCGECRKTPALPNNSVCAPCLEEGQRMLAEAEKKYGID